MNSQGLLWNEKLARIRESQCDHHAFCYNSVCWHQTILLPGSQCVYTQVTIPGKKKTTMLSLSTLNNKLTLTLNNREQLNDSWEVLWRGFLLDTFKAVTLTSCPFTSFIWTHSFICSYLRAIPSGTAEQTSEEEAAINVCFDKVRKKRKKKKKKTVLAQARAYFYRDWHASLSRAR